MTFVACSTSVRCNSSLEKALSDIASAGFREIDLLTIDGWVHVNPSELATSYESTIASFDLQLKQYGLTPIAMNSGVGPQLHDRTSSSVQKRSAEIAGLVRFMIDYGIQIAAIQPRNAAKDRPYSEVLADCVETIQEQVALGEEAGVRFALELHVWSPFETMEQARILLEAYPEVPLVYDPTHFVMQGVPIRETEWLMDHAKHVHLRDAAKDKMQVPLGQGEVDFDWIFGALRDRGYTGGFSIEYLETDDFDSLEEAKRLNDLIRRHL